MKIICTEQQKVKMIELINSGNCIEEVLGHEIECINDNNSFNCKKCIEKQFNFEIEKN